MSSGVWVADPPADDAEGAERGNEFDMILAERAFLDRQCPTQALLSGVQVADARIDRA